MKKNTYTLNTVLAIVLGAVMLAFVLARTFAPRVILFELDIPNLVLISLAALLVDHYLAPNADRCYVCIPVFSAITFGLLPFALSQVYSGTLRECGETRVPMAAGIAAVVVNLLLMLRTLWIPIRKPITLA